jgi:hypothetical protein
VIAIEDASATSNAEDDLAAAVAGVVRALGAHLYGFNHLPGALVEYRPTIPPRFHYRDVLRTPQQRAPALVHEFCHVVLHPPGSQSGGEHEHPDEERAVHEAADRICKARGVEGYRSLMASHGVVVTPTLPEDEPLVDSVTERVLSALEDPGSAAGW